MSIFSPLRLVDHLADPGPPSPHAGADRVDVGVVGGDGDLGPVARLPGAGLYLHHPVGDLGHLQLEQALHQAGMGSADHDLGAFGRLADLHDVGLEAGVGVGPLIGNLLGLGQQRLHPTQVEQGVAGVGLLDHAGDDVALPAGVLLVLELPLRLPDALGHDLAGGLGRDPPEVVGGDLELLAHRFAHLVEVLGEDPELHGLGVDGDPGVLVRARQALVGRFQRVGQSGQQGVDGDPPLGGQSLECFHHLGVHDAASLWCELRWDGPHSKTVRAQEISS